MITVPLNRILKFLVHCMINIPKERLQFKIAEARSVEWVPTRASQTFVTDVGNY